MRTLRIRGGKPLNGRIRISGGKNAALPVLAACVCFREPCVVQDCPDLTDVDAALDILASLGARWSRQGSTVTVDPRPVCRWEIPAELTEKMRGSLFFMGPLMARFGACTLHMPGGCAIGERPVDFHLRGLEQLGAQVEHRDIISCKGALRGTDVFLPYPSVGATENLLMAALGAEGDTRIHNAAREPEICCLCDFLRSGGCRISGDGTGTICIRSGLPCRGEIRLIPDRMEAATYLCAVASAGGKVTLENTRPDHLEAVTRVLARAGCHILAGENEITISAQDLTSPGRIETGPYPEFPTDAQATVMAALLRARGETEITEQVFSGRMRHVPALRTMGGHIVCRDNTAVVTGVSCLRGGLVRALDLRGGAALMVAALATEDETEISGFAHIARGYEDMAGKLRSLGADSRIC